LLPLPPPPEVEAWHGIVLLPNSLFGHVAEDKEMDKLMDQWIDQLDSLSIAPMVAG
jgi:hypothetical protein